MTEEHRSDPFRSRLRLILPAVLLLVGGCSETKVDQPAAPVATRFYRVTEAETRYAYSAFGQFRFRRQIEFGFINPGLVTMVAPEAGQTVRRGAILARIEPTVSEATMQAAVARKKSADAQLDRIAELRRQGWVSNAQHEVVVAQASQARADVVAARFQRAQAIMRASSDIIVLSRNAEPGQVVAAGQSVLTAGDARQGLVFIASLAAGDIGQLRIGDTARISVPGSNATPLSGRVVEIAGQADPRTGLFDVKVQLSQAAKIAPGQSGRVDLEPTGLRGQPLMIVPSQAVFDVRAGIGFVYVLDPATSRLRVRKLVLGEPRPNGVAIINGLSVGDQVAVANLANLRDGQFVNQSRQPETGGK